MLKELIDYIKEYEGDNDLGDYLDTRYIRLTEQHHDQIAVSYTHLTLPTNREV